MHTQAEDFERRVAGPRREQKLKELESKMRAIRGLKDEGVVLGGESGSSRLLEDDFEGEGSGWVTIALKLPDRSARRKFRITQRVQVWDICTWAFSLFVHVVVSCFVQSLYTWLDSLGYSSDEFLLTTLFPKNILDDKQQTLEQVGLTNDTTLAVEERND